MTSVQSMLQDIEIEVKLTSHMIGKKALDARVMAAMARVPRQEFVPEELQGRAFYNGPLPIGKGQTISQPYIVALMSDLLNPKEDHVILEIGTGSGYQTAVLACLVRQVYSIEIIEELSVASGERLERLGYHNVELRSGDGYHGWLEHEPYDGIIVTAAAPHIPRPLIDQLRVGGRLVIPVGEPYAYQELKVLEKKAEGKIETQNVLGVSFVPLTGKHAEDTAYRDDDRFWR
ncbi:MAG: protein-L-isoaspartate(D-aspartate) O-methyltransferase [Methylococcaceae bacterium]|nr:protein-L-isoaspartate(D-aspartate) O-methyltransferase [Methylococcaceae bacterium]